MTLCPMTSPKVPTFLGGMVMMMAPPPRAAVRFLVLHIRYVAHGKCSVTASCVIRSLESAGTAV